MRPLILDFKVSRQDVDVSVPYTYSISEAMNMIEVEGQLIPFIDSESPAMELQTKTKVHREADDVRGLLELKTKTENRRERDDRSDNFLELKTKTFVAREKDD